MHEEAVCVVGIDAAHVGAEFFKLFESVPVRLAGDRRSLEIGVALSFFSVAGGANFCEERKFVAGGEGAERKGEDRKGEGGQFPHSSPWDDSLVGSGPRAKRSIAREQRGAGG